MLRMTPARWGALGALGLVLAGFIGRGPIGNAAGVVGDTAGRAFNAANVVSTPVCVNGVHVVTGTNYDTGMPTVRFVEGDALNSPQGPHWGQDVPGATRLGQHVRLVYIDQGCQPTNEPDSGLVALTFEGDVDGQLEVETVVYDVSTTGGARVVADQVSPVIAGHDQVAGGQWTLDPSVRGATYVLTGPDGQTLNTVDAPIGEPVLPTPAA